MPPSRSWFPDSGRGSQWRPRALDCDGRRERSVRVGRSGAAGAPNGDVHSVGARRCLGPTSNRNARFSALFFEKLDFKICIAPSRRDSTSHDSGNVERAPPWQTVWRDRWRTNFKSWASTPEIQTVESERLFLAPCWDEAEKIGPRKTPASAVNSRESLACVVVSEGAGSRALGSVGSRGAFRRVGSFPRIPLPRHPTFIADRTRPPFRPIAGTSEKSDRSPKPRPSSRNCACRARRSSVVIPLARHSPSPCRVGVPI